MSDSLDQLVRALKAQEHINVKYGQLRRRLSRVHTPYWRLAMHIGICNPDPYAEVLRALGWQEVTKWYMWRGYHRYFNHIENGHNQGFAPTPQSEDQKLAWKGQRWSKCLSYMTMDLPAVILI